MRPVKTERTREKNYGSRRHEKKAKGNGKIRKWEIHDKDWKCDHTFIVILNPFDIWHRGVPGSCIQCLKGLGLERNAVAKENSCQMPPPSRTLPTSYTSDHDPAERRSTQATPGPPGA